jgi:sugar phosphate isomerase/epimerase
MTKLTRRDFLQTTLGLAAACAAGTVAYGADAEKKARRNSQGKNQPGVGSGKKIALGCQLYAVRSEFTKDVPGTLKTLAQMGYEGVEFWGYRGTPNVYKDAAGKDWSAAQLKQLLDENRLKCCGIHLSVAALEDANLSTTIANNKILGHRYLNIASAQKEMKSAESIKQFAQFLNAASVKAAAQQMLVGYHCHGGDFARVDGRMAYEMLFEQLKPEVNMQVDVGHALKAGVDPVVYFKKFAGRAKTVHLRETDDKKFDSPAYQELFQVMETVAGTEWYIVEEEKGNNFDFSRQAIEKLRKIGK